MESIFEPRIIMDKYVDDKFINATLEKFKENDIIVTVDEVKSLIKTHVNYYMCDPLEPLGIDGLQEYYIMFAKKETSLTDDTIIIKTIGIIYSIFDNIFNERLSNVSNNLSNIVRPNRRMNDMILINRYGNKGVVSELPELSLRQEKETDKKFASIMKSHGKEKCPSCKKIIDRGDVSWNNPSTEAGTAMTVVEIQCQKCYTEIVHGTSWYPGAEDFEELVDDVLEDIFE